MNKEELDFILQQGEGQFVEFKESYTSTIAEEIVAFANSKGGTIFLGISDKGEAKGINITNNLKSNIYDLANNCDPKIAINLKIFNNILMVIVDESHNKPHACSSGFYLRIGANSQKLSRDEILKFAVSEGLKSFDEELNYQFNYPLDFDLEKFSDYLLEAKIANSLDTETVLINLGVAKKIKGELFLNNAGVLFFAKEPSKFYLTSKVICAEYATNEKVDILDKKVYDEGIISNIRQAVNFVKKRAKTSFIIEKLAREEVPQLPENAYREAIVNSIMHRDYFDKSSDVLVEFFRNKLIISNPGGLVTWLNPEDFGKISKTRNSIIASLLVRTIYVEKMGTGIKRIKDSMSEFKLPEPEFVNREHYFFTTLYDKEYPYSQLVSEGLNEGLNEGLSEGLNEGLSEGLNSLLSVIKKNPGIKAKDISELLSRPTKTVERQIKTLQEKYYIVRRGSKKTGGYWENRD